MQNTPNKEFEKKLIQAAKKQLTSSEKFEQKVSFIYSSVDSEKITKEHIRKLIGE